MRLCFILLILTLCGCSQKKVQYLGSGTLKSWDHFDWPDTQFASLIYPAITNGFHGFVATEIIVTNILTPNFEYREVLHFQFGTFEKGKVKIVYGSFNFDHGPQYIPPIIAYSIKGGEIKYLNDNPFWVKTRELYLHNDGGDEMCGFSINHSLEKITSQQEDLILSFRCMFGGDGVVYSTDVLLRPTGNILKPIKYINYGREGKSISHPTTNYIKSM